MMELFLKLGMFIIDIIKKPEIDVEEIEFVGEKEMVLFDVRDAKRYY